MLVRAAATSLSIGLVFAACGGTSPSSAPETIPPGAIAVSAKDYEFDPGSLTAPAGEVVFAVTNGSSQNHEFEVMSGEESLGKIDAFGPGSTRALSVTLQAGDYQIICRLNGHDVLGMKGTLTVGGS